MYNTPKLDSLPIFVETERGTATRHFININCIKSFGKKENSISNIKREGFQMQNQQNIKLISLFFS